MEILFAQTYENKSSCSLTRDQKLLSKKLGKLCGKLISDFYNCSCFRSYLQLIDFIFWTFFRLQT